jgi:alkylhydroperoxidase/carboxymuconolactone decarboxylase family protein YurZ
VDDKTQLLVCLGAAVAANCAPCFKYYYGKVLAASLPPSDIKEAVALGGQIRQGSAIAMTNSVKKIMGGHGGQSVSGHPCCPDSLQSGSSN